MKQSRKENDMDCRVTSFLAMTKPAFSLIEMLMALLVASLLLAALAPVMTRKFTENINVSGTLGSGTAPAMFKCWDYDHPELQYADDNSGLKILPNDYQIDDAWTINFILASGGGGGAGATISKTIEDSYIEPGSGKSEGIKIGHDMDDFEIEFMTGGGGGAGGGAGYTYTITGSPNATSCKQYGINKSDTSGYRGSYGSPVVVADGHGLCVTAYNQVWSSGCVTYSYGGFSTPVCGYQSNANAACASALKGKWGGNWRLPTLAEGQKWNFNFISSTPAKGGLYLCNGTNGQPNPYCPYTTGTGIWPRSIWTSVPGPKKNECSNGGATHYTCGTDGGWSCGGASCSYIFGNSHPDYHSVRCVLSDNIPATYFRSLSGGGGGGAPAIKENDFDTAIKELFIKRIKENIGGYIVLSAGSGGKGGNKAGGALQKAENGENGKDSCIYIKNSEKQIKYELCVPGGNAGSGADATSKNSTSTDGFGIGGEAINATNACYVIDYTINSTGVKTTFNCTSGGNAGTNGIAGQNNPSAGGKGGASVNNPSVQAANNGNAGVTPSSTANPGAGGGGGSATMTESGTNVTYAYGSGGGGANGYIKLKYKHRYEAAGGGGGGGGYVAHIKNISVGKSASCAVKVGYGGIGGAAGISGTDGGNSSITCSNAPNVTYEITGGKGGETGTSASELSDLSKGGKGGEAGGYIDTGNIFTRLFSQGNMSGHKGLDGKDGGSGDSANYKIMVRSSGGRGGTSGTGEKGKCGGIYNEKGICSNVSADENNDIAEPKQNDLDGKGFSGGDVSIPTKESIVEGTPKYGKAGAGGGGGAWYTGKDPGRGGNGQAGYVCIYWDKLE